MSLRRSSYVAPKSPRGASKTQNGRFSLKNAFRLKIIIDFLTDRSQRVVLRAGMSAFSKVVSGVPQGNVLVPLLFLLYVISFMYSRKSNGLS